MKKGMRMIFTRSKNLAFAVLLGIALFGYSTVAEGIVLPPSTLPEARDPAVPRTEPEINKGWHIDLVDYVDQNLVYPPPYVYNLGSNAYFSIIDWNVYLDGDNPPHSFDSQEIWDVYDNGVLILTTSKEPFPSAFGDNDFLDMQWQDDKTPKGRVLLEPGFHSLTFTLSQYGGVSDGVAFFTRMDTVPVPAAVWLLGSGLIGLIGLRRTIRG